MMQEREQHPGVWFPRRVVAVGRLPPGVVWSRYTRPAAWPTWAPHIRSVDYPFDTVEPGATGSVVGVAGARATFRVTAVDPDARRWSWCVRYGPLRLRFDHGVDPHPRGCAAWMTTDAAWPVAAGYAPIASWALARLVTSAV